jgi:hypothetical protein
VENIEFAAKTAVEAGAQIAYGPQKHDARGPFAILIASGTQHGLESSPLGGVLRTIPLRQAHSRTVLNVRPS